MSRTPIRYDDDLPELDVPARPSAKSPGIGRRADAWSAHEPCADPLKGSNRYSSVTRTNANGEPYTPALRDRWETVYFPAIRTAALPEE
jgi:hypothetical protein